MKKFLQISLFSLAFGSFTLASCDIFSFVGPKNSSVPSSVSLSSTLPDSSSSVPVSSTIDSLSSGSSLEGGFDALSFHFIEQNVPNTGDLTYIKAGENDILIDGGAAKGVAKTAKAYIDQYVTDGKLEYVFVTHAHEDHIAGLVGVSDKSKPGGRDGLLYSYKIDNIVDFSYFSSNKVTVDNSPSHTLTEDESKKTSQIYKDYRDARAYAISGGAAHHVAKELTTKGNNWKVDLGKGLSVTLLYQFYYDHTRADTKELNPSYSLSNFSDQNDCSLGLLFRQGEKQFLFTGDMEEYAEASLAESNPELGKVSLFKAGHHGSPTANTAKLLSKIQPEAVVACCCAGNTEYGQTTKETTFPGQAVIDRVAPYTDRFYVTTEGSYTDKKYHKPLNGNIVFSYDENGNETVTCSDSGSLLKDTPWFKENRTSPKEWESVA